MYRRHRFLVRLVLVGFVFWLLRVRLGKNNRLEYTDFSHTGRNIDAAPLIERLRDGDQRFLWADWLDLSRADLFAQSYRENYGFELINFNVDSYFPPSGPLEEVSVAGQLYCKYNLSAPYQIALLPEQVHLDPVNITLFPVVHGQSPSLNHKQYGDFSIQSSRNKLLPLREKNIQLLDQWFEWEPSEDPMVQEALKDVPLSQKHFFEADLSGDVARHYDWRFFRGELCFEEKLQVLHELARTWSSFSRAAGIKSWFAHGSLLGWWWNGLTMPWDTDHDVQMPVAELDILGRFWNRSLVVQGNRKYLIDVSPWYVERTRGNRHNLIDARFIDVHSGMFIDITGLAKISDSYTCKNSHSYSLEQLSPLVLTTFEGAPSLIPFDTESVLKSEYKRYKRVQTGHWRFNSVLRLWEPMTMLCDSENLQRSRCLPAIENDVCEEWKYGTCNVVMLRYFDVTKDLTRFHLDNRLEPFTFPTLNYVGRLLGT